MDGADLYALCLFLEAGNQPPEGRRAVARVIANRIAQRYFSDGTAPGTILAYDQFSWAYFAGQPYERVCSTQAEAAARAATLLPDAQASELWPDCQQAVIDGQIGSPYAWGPQGLLLNAEPRALLYCNEAISHPVWATAEARICKIFAHTFFRA